MPKVVATYAPKMSNERADRITAALKKSGANLGKRMKHSSGGWIGWSDVDWIENEDGTGTELTVTFNHAEPQNRVHDRDRAVRLAAELRCCGMVATVEEIDEAVK